MKNVKIALTFCILITLFSCGYGVSKEEALINGYFIGWNDLVSNRGIYIKDPSNPNIGQVIISSYVYSVGFDDRFILAKSLPNAGNTDFKAYYILDTNGYYNSNMDNNNLQVFFDENKFNAQVALQKLDGIKFNMNYTMDPY